MSSFVDKLRLKELAEEDVYFARKDRDLIRALRRRKEAGSGEGAVQDQAKPSGPPPDQGAQKDENKDSD
jgi:hypothetical protein